MFYVWFEIQVTAYPYSVNLDNGEYLMNDVTKSIWRSRPEKWWGYVIWTQILLEETWGKK